MPHSHRPGGLLPSSSSDAPTSPPGPLPAHSKERKIHSLERELTELDYVRLRKLNASNGNRELADVLANAEVIPGSQIDANVLTMNTRFELEELDTGERRVLTLKYPDDAQPADGSISVLSPLGCSLIGLRPGDTAQWHTPSGNKSALVRAVLFQPEASGDYVS